MRLTKTLKIEDALNPSQPSKLCQNKVVQNWLARRMSLHNVLFRHAAKLSRLVQTRADGADAEWQNCTTRQEVETSTCRCSGGKVDTLAEIFAD